MSSESTPHSQFALLKTHRFAPFFVTQFLGAFNDNLYKNALVVLLTFHAASWTTLAPEVLTNLVAGIFIVPYFSFSVTAGQLAEGRITYTGEFYPFRPGIQRFFGQTPVPVIPLALRGLWGSFFSRKDGPAMSKPLRRGLFSRICLVVGAPVAAHAATPEHLQTLVAELRGDLK